MNYSVLINVFIPTYLPTGHYYVTLNVEVRIIMPIYIFNVRNESLFDIAKEIYQRPAVTNRAV